jgi:meiotic recombination protein REC8, fungi type
VGREAPPALEDQSFPWNVSVSATGSRPGSIIRAFGLPSSAGRPSSLIVPGGGIPGSLDRRASRIASASPLLGRGQQRYSSLELPIHEDDDELLGLQQMSASNEVEDFQLYGPAAGVSTQVAAESQWVRATLDKESGNFLEFIKTEIIRRRMALGEEDVGRADPTGVQNAVLFENILLPSEHTKIVAAQALHHVLALATKGLINVQQNMAYGPIKLSLRAQA